MTAGLIISFIFLACAIILLIAIHFEKKAFNNCHCSQCQKKLRHFDTDSQGGRGYICDNCKTTVWISFNTVDKRVFEKM